MTYNIKTVAEDLKKVNLFDKRVNDLLAEGWQLQKRGFIKGYPMTADTCGTPVLYAELTLPINPPDDPEIADLIEAVQAIHKLCKKMEFCEDCPLQNHCGWKTPDGWIFTDDE